MERTSIQRIACSAVFAAVIFVSTAFIPLPLPFSPNGYFNFGDCFVIIAGICLGPVWGGLAGGVGAAVSDLILGYAFYSPATFLIKFIMAASAYTVYKGFKLSFKSAVAVKAALAATVAEGVMVAGYFAYEFIIYDLSVAAADVVGNSLQGACGIIASVIIFGILHKTPLYRNLKSIGRKTK